MIPGDFRALPRTARCPGVHCAPDRHAEGYVHPFENLWPAVNECLQCVEDVVLAQVRRVRFDTSEPRHKFSDHRNPFAGTLQPSCKEACPVDGLHPLPEAVERFLVEVLPVSAPVNLYSARSEEHTSEL